MLEFHDAKQIAFRDAEAWEPDDWAWLRFDVCDEPVIRVDCSRYPRLDAADCVILGRWLLRQSERLSALPASELARVAPKKRRGARLNCARGAGNGQAGA